MSTPTVRSRIPVRWLPLGLAAVLSSGCLAAGLATRGAPASEVRSFEVELPPVDLPAANVGPAKVGPSGVRPLDPAGIGRLSSGPAEGLPAEHGPLSPGDARPGRARHGVILRPLWLEVPVDGWMHGFEFELVDAEGEPVPSEVLHHLKVISPERRELFSPLMLRIAAAGAETNPVLLPSRIGYPLTRGDTLLVTAMLHNATGERLEGVRLRIRLRYTPEGSWRPPAEVVPFFTHVTPPLEESEYDLPPGRSRRSIEVRPAVAGRILGLGGHLHRYGTALRLSEVETGRILWDRRAERAPDGSILEIPNDVFVWSGGIEVRPDRSYRVTAFYDNPTGRAIPDGGMGTVGGVILPDGPWPRVDRTEPAYRWDMERETRGSSR